MKASETHLRAFVIFRPKLFLLAAAVVLNDFICRVKNILRRTVVALKLHHARIRKDLFKIQDIADVGAAELIYALVIVADDAEVLITARKEAHEAELRRICILVFVDHQIPETLLIILQHLGVRLKKLYGLNDQVVEIHGVIFFQAVLIVLVNPGNLPAPPVAPVEGGIFFGRNEFVLRRRNHPEDCFFLQILRIDVLPAEDLLHQRQLIIGIVNGKIPRIAQLVGMAS